MGHQIAGEAGAAQASQIVGIVEHALSRRRKRARRRARSLAWPMTMRSASRSIASATMRRWSDSSACSKRFAGSSTMARVGLPISSSRRRAFAAVETMLASSGSMPSRSPYRSVIAIALSISARMSRQCFGRAVVGVAAPLVVGIARARAQRDEAGPHRRTGGGDDFEPAQPVGAHRRIGMRHVVGAGNGAERDAVLLRGIGNRGGKLRRNFIRHGRQAGTCHVVLRRGEAGRLHLCQNGVRIGSRNVLGKNAEPHQTSPDTSSRRTGLPLRTDSAIATMARTEATPSSMSAPRIGAPSRITLAKPSS